MNRTAFDNLYLHANSIVTLAFLRSMARLFSAPAPAEPTPEMQALVSGIEHDMANPTSFNWAALEGIDAEVDALIEQQDAALADDLPFFSQCIELPEDDDAMGSMPDVGVFLGRVEAARGMLAPRMADSFAKVDHGALAGHLAALPAALPPLTGSLSAVDLERWVELYETGHAHLLAVVEETRKPEPAL